MRIKLIIVGLVFWLLGFGAKAEASWVMVPPEGYGCPLGFEIVTVDTQEDLLTVCIPEAAPALSPEETTPTDTEPGEDLYVERVV